MKNRIKYCVLFLLFAGFSVNISGAIVPRWTADDSRFTNNMTMTAVVVNSGVEARSEQIEIGAFSNGECRGSSLIQYVSGLDRYMCFLMIFGEGGESVSLKVFDHATGEEYDVNNAPLTFAADAIHGNPSEPYLITIGDDPVFTWTVTVSDGSGSGSYAEGELVSIVADVPPIGQQFAAWDITPSVVFVTGGMNTSAAEFIMPTQSVVVEAVYEPLPTGNYLITVTSEGYGTALADAVSAPQDAVITLTATAHNGYRFAEWQVVSGGVTIANANANPATFTMPDSPVEVKAIFELIPSATFAVTVVSAGTGATGSGSYAGGVTVNINAGTPPEGQRFKNWSTTSAGVVFADANKATTFFIMPVNAVTITANFEAIPPVYEVMFSVMNGNGVIAATVDASAISTGDSIEEGKNIVFTAAPAADYIVKEWTLNNSVVIGNTTTVFTLSNLTEDVTVTVEFDIPIDNPVFAPAHPFRAWICNGLLHVKGLTTGEVWSVYTVTGALIYSNVASNAEAVITVRGSGIYIVRSGHRTIKVASGDKL